MPEDSQLQVGGRVGGGLPPGYQWNVGILSSVYSETVKLIGESGYANLKHQVQDLARHDDPSHAVTQDIDAVSNFFELRDRGSGYGGANIRLFFGIDKSIQSIIVLGVIKKQNNGPTPKGDKIRIGRRWRNYMNGSYGRFIP